MAHSLYMLCCLSGAVDKKSNQVSHFNVVEGLQINFHKTPPGGSTPVPIPLQLQIVSTWARDDDDAPNDSFEIEVSFQRTGEKVNLLHKATFQFKDSIHHRFTIQLVIMPRSDFRGGAYRFQSRIRKVGARRWLRQEYVIPVDVKVLDDTTPPQSNGKKKPKSKKR